MGNIETDKKEDLFLALKKYKITKSNFEYDI